MFVVLIEATTQAENGRRLGDRHAVIAIVDCEESECMTRAAVELESRGWSAVECKRYGAVVADAPADGPLAAAIADAKDSGIALVVYDTPIARN